MSNQEDIEQRIREQRIVEANKKNLVGQNGKIGTVLRMMGGPIIAHQEGGGYRDIHYMDTSGLFEDEDPSNNIELMKKIPVMDLDGNERPSGSEWTEMEDPAQYGITTIGWHFDGLSRGMHMEIKYDDALASMELSYKGYPAYKEVKGEIVCYVPNEQWEMWIDSLYRRAREMTRKQNEEEFNEKVKQAEKRKQDWWSDIVSRWGQ